MKKFYSFTRSLDILQKIKEKPPKILVVGDIMLDRFIFGDVQCSSQVGLITRFKNCTLLCPNEKEARIAMQDKDSGLEKLSQSLIKITKTERLIMKLGAEGFIAYDNSVEKIKTQSFPALSWQIKTEIGLKF